MKRTLLYIGSVFILILSAITFIFLPAHLQKTPNGLSFGSYDGKKIELAQGTEFANALANLEDLYKDNFSQVERIEDENQRAYYRQMLQYNMYNDAFNAAVTNIAYSTEVKKSGYEPSAAAISRAMVPYFLDEAGNYSQKRYNATPESTRNDMRKSIRSSLVWSRYYEDTFGTNATVGGNTLFGLKVSRAEQEFLAGMGAEKRSFDLAAWDKSSFPESELASYGITNSGLFYRHPLSVISFSDKAQAEKTLKQLNNNEITFEDAVSDLSDKYYTGDDGKLTSNFEYQIKEIISDADSLQAVLFLKKGELSDIVQMANNSYSIFRADDETDTSFVAEDNVDVIRTYINTHDAGIIEEFYLNLARNFVANAVANGFDRACRDADVTKETVPAVALNYGSVALVGDPVETALLQNENRNEHLLEKAYSLKNGEVSEPIVLTNTVIVLKQTGEQTDAVTDEKKDAVLESLASLNAAAAQNRLFSGDKVQNNVYETFITNLVN